MLFNQEKKNGTCLLGWVEYQEKVEYLNVQHELNAIQKIKHFYPKKYFKSQASFAKMTKHDF